MASGELLLLRSPSQGSGDDALPTPTAGDDSLVSRPVSLSGVARADPGGSNRGKSGSGDIDNRRRRLDSCSVGGAIRRGVGDIRESSLREDEQVHNVGVRSGV